MMELTMEEGMLSRLGKKCSKEVWQEQVFLKRITKKRLILSEIILAIQLHLKKNRIAYDNSIEIESNKENIMEMKRIVRQDDGAGPLYGGKEKWNREYGGTNEDGVIIEQTKGPIGNPRTVGASIIITTSPKTKYSFHSHCSGWIYCNGIMSDYVQSPSQADISAAVGTDYVFGRADKMVYIYNKQGVQAVLPMKAF